MRSLVKITTAGSIVIAMAPTHSAAAPEESWTIAPHQSKCLLIQPGFGSSTGVSLALMTEPPSLRVQLMLDAPEGTKLNDTKVFSANQELKFTRNVQTAANGRVRVAFSLAGDERRLLLGGPTFPALQVKDSTSSIIMDVKPQQLQKLKSCESEMLVHWGIDPDWARSISTRPIGARGNWIELSDYPGEAIKNRQQGVVTFIWMIDEQGKPRNCRVIESSGFPLLDQATCSAMMRRGKSIKAAYDTLGKSVPFWLRRTTVWKLPR